MEDPLKKAETLTKSINDFMESRSRGVLSRYPLLFSLLGTFGVVSIIYGFEGIVDHISYLHDRQYLLFFIGLLILIFTGSLYKKIDQHMG